jgi:hypothetical protein
MSAPYFPDFSRQSPPSIHSAAMLRQTLLARASVDTADLRGLDRVLGHDCRQALIEVQARTTWDALAGFAAASGALDAWKLHPFIPATVGDWVASNAPAPDGRPAVHFVEALTLFTPEGELRRVSRDLNPDLFACAIGGQHIFGLIYSITLRVDALLCAAAGFVGAPPALARCGADGDVNVDLLVPPDMGTHMEDAARAICGEWRIPLGQALALRTGTEHETRLNWARRELHWVRLSLRNARRLGTLVRLRQAQAALIDAAIALGGGYFPGTTCALRADQLIACHPAIRELLAKKSHYDPACRISNAWYRHQLGLLSTTAGVET